MSKESRKQHQSVTYREELVREDKNISRKGSKVASIIILLIALSVLVGGIVLAVISDGSADLLVGGIIMIVFGFLASFLIGFMWVLPNFTRRGADEKVHQVTLRAAREILGKQAVVARKVDVSKNFLREIGMSDLELRKIGTRITWSEGKLSFASLEASTEVPASEMTKEIGGSLLAGIVSGSVILGAVGAAASAVARTADGRNDSSQVFNGTILIVTGLSKKAQKPVEVRGKSIAVPTSKEFGKSSRIETESIGFNERFDTFAEDGESALYILTPPLIESLLQLPEGYGYAIRYFGNTIAVLIAGFSPDFPTAQSKATKGHLADLYDSVRSSASTLKEIAGKVLTTAEKR